ncbi:MAG: VOC family protein [Anaerolineae bacterium]
MQTIVPMIDYEDGPAAMDWLCRAFGFEEGARIVEPNGWLSHGELTYRGGRILLASPSPDYRSPRSRRDADEREQRLAKLPWVIDGILVYVEDVETHYARALAAGATILSKPSDEGIGWLYRAEDPEGHRWMFLQPHASRESD